MSKENKKYILTDVSITVYDRKLFQIKALQSFGNVDAGDLGGYIEKEDNLSVYGNAWVSGNANVYGNAWVSGNARVSGDAQVYGNAHVSGNALVSGSYQYTQGRFIGGDDSEKITRIEDQCGTNYWKAQYVLGDYEITPLEEEIEEPKGLQEIALDGVKYRRVDE